MAPKKTDKGAELENLSEQPTDEPEIGSDEVSGPDEDEDYDSDFDGDEEELGDVEEESDEEDEEEEDEEIDDEEGEEDAEDVTDLEGLTAQHVEDAIASEDYVELPSGQGHICELTMNNGFLVIGGTVSELDEPPTPEKSKAKAREKAFRKAFEFEAYALVDRNHKEGSGK